jgi:DNA polymerase-3 subunit beta
MEFSVGRDELYRCLQRLQGFIDPKGPMPILSNLLIQSAGKGIFISATNLDIALKKFCPAAVTDSGSLTINSKKLHDIVRELPEGEIHLTQTDNQWARLTCGNSKFRLSLLPVDDFPPFPKFQEESMKSIDGPTLGEMIGKTAHAISQDETRYMLNGVLLQIYKDHMRMVSTDGHRLAFVKRPVSMKLEKEIEVIIPKKAVQELNKLTEEEGEELKFTLQDNHLIFKKDETVFVSRLLEGKFPNYEQVIPSKNTKVAKVPVEEMTHALKRVVILADEKSKMVKLQFSKGKLELTSEATELGDAMETLEVDYAKEDISIGVNAVYLIDVLTILKEEKVSLNMEDSLSPLLIKSAEDENFLSIVMPMRL